MRTSIEHIEYISDNFLTIERAVSLLLITLTQPVSLLLIQDTEYDYLKFYHNWANCLGIVAFALLLNASESRDVSFDYYAFRFFEAALPCSVLSNIVYWWLVDTDVISHL